MSVMGEGIPLTHSVDPLIVYTEALGLVLLFDEADGRCHWRL